MDTISDITFDMRSADNSNWLTPGTIPVSTVNGFAARADAIGKDIFEKVSSYCRNRCELHGSNCPNSCELLGVLELVKGREGLS